MFETAELGRRVAKAEYESEVPKLRAELLELQRAAREAGLPVLVVVSGADGSGKGEAVKRLSEWLDPRGVDTHAFTPPSEEESERPRYWRYWLSLPPRGRIGVFFGSWYTEPILDRAYGRIGRARFERMLSRIAFFEQMLADDGALVVKLWFHLGRKNQKKRLKRLERDPATAWRVTPVDWKHHRKYDRFIEVSEHVIRRTDTAHAPWFLVEAVDERYRDLMAGRTLAERLRGALSRVEQPKGRRASRPDPTPPPAPSPEASVTVLDRVQLASRLSDAEYQRRLARAQGRLGRVARAAWEKRISSVAVFEGWDAAGKGGAIRRVTEALDPRLYRIIPVAAPTDEEKAHHYLWRFWRHIPRAGSVTLYDRSWYGRVLVERVEGFARPEEWMRAYLEINEFESQLVEHGIALSKFWLHIDQDEQLRRFKEREKIAYKRHKITEEDWRNREKWDAYEAAVNDMVARTSTLETPWTLVAASDKKQGRVQVLEAFVARLERALG